MSEVYEIRVEVGEAFKLVRGSEISLKDLRALKRGICGYHGTLKEKINAIMSVTDDPSTKRSPARKEALKSASVVRKQINDLRSMINTKISLILDNKGNGKYEKLIARRDFIAAQIAKYDDEYTKVCTQVQNLSETPTEEENE